jgi:hypothetical protein
MRTENIKCLCNEPLCAKCLSTNCKDKNCQIHSRETKMKWQKNWEMRNKRPWSEPKNY